MVTKAAVELQKQNDSKFQKDDHIGSNILTIKEDYMPPEILSPLKNRSANSSHRLSRLDMQRAITDVKRFVERRLEEDLKLVKVRAEDIGYIVQVGIFIYKFSIVLLYSFFLSPK